MIYSRDSQAHRLLIAKLHHLPKQPPKQTE